MLALASSDIMRWQVAHKTWATDRSRGAKKIGAKLQNSIHRFRQYLDSYSGVVEIVKQADPIFGPIACSTLSVFLVVKS